MPNGRIGQPGNEHTRSASSFLKEDQLAARWQLSVKALQRWRLIGEGPSFVRLGRAIRYRSSDIEDFELARHSNNPNDRTVRQTHEYRASRGLWSAQAQTHRNK